MSQGSILQNCGHLVNSVLYRTITTSVFIHALTPKGKDMPNYFLSLDPDLSKNTTIHTNSSLKTFLKFAGEKSIFDGVLTPTAIATFSLKLHRTHLISLLANEVWAPIRKDKMNKTLKCYLVTSVNVIFSILLSNQLSQKINQDIKLVEDQRLLWQETSTHVHKIPRLGIKILNFPRNKILKQFYFWAIEQFVLIVTFLKEKNNG